MPHISSCIPMSSHKRNPLLEFMDGYFYFGKTRLIVTANRGNGVLELKKTQLKSVICQTILKIVTWFTGFIPLFAAIWALGRYIHVQKSSKNWLLVQENPLPNSSNPPSPFNQIPIQNPIDPSPTNDPQPTLATKPIGNESSNPTSNPTPEANLSPPLKNNSDNLIEEWIADNSNSQIQQFFREQLKMFKPVKDQEETENQGRACQLLNQLPLDIIQYLFQTEVNIPNSRITSTHVCFHSLFEMVSKDRKEKIISGLVTNPGLAKLDFLRRCNVYIVCLSAIDGRFNQHPGYSKELTQDEMDLFLIFVSSLQKPEDKNWFQTISSLIQLQSTHTFMPKLASTIIITALRNKRPNFDKLIKKLLSCSKDHTSSIVSNLKLHCNEQEIQTFKDIFHGTNDLQAIQDLLL